MKDFFEEKKRIHFVGVGGIGVSALARHFIREGRVVTGSDTSLQKELEKEGVVVFCGHKKENILKKTDLLIYSNAISSDNPEIVEAKKRKIKVISYPEAIGILSKKYFTIAVSGTHGKSTTTAMIALIMIKGGLDPTVIIGTKLKEFGNKNYRRGKSKYLLIEADEYKAAFLNYYPKIAVITNIEADHLDFYKNEKDVVSTFQKYITENLNGKTVILNNDDKNSKKIKVSEKTKRINYSIKEDVVEKIKLSVFGEHNLYNALASFFITKELGIKEDVILQSLFSFKGTWRRFDEDVIFLKNQKKVIIVNDYAHHPTEVRATVLAVKEKYPKEKIIFVFQPHQYERTYHLFNMFVKTFSNLLLSHLFITDIYTVKGRESEEVKKRVNSKKLTEKIKKAKYLGSVQETVKYLAKSLQGDEILVIMGAGDVYSITSLLKREIKKENTSK